MPDLSAELATVRERVHRLPRERWESRPATGRWSPGEHVVHLARTTRAFLPLLEPPRTDREAAIRDFDEAQKDLTDFLRKAAGRALDKVKIVSPFDGRVRYNAWSALRIMAAHQRRHLWLIERDI